MMLMEIKEPGMLQRRISKLNMWPPRLQGNKWIFSIALEVLNYWPLQTNCSQKTTVKLQLVATVAMKISPLVLEENILENKIKIINLPLAFTKKDFIKNILLQMIN